MANRTLTIWTEEQNQNGYHSVARIERSSAGQPAGLFIIDNFQNNELVSNSCVVIEDLEQFLEPVLRWLERGKEQKA